jgi:organic radical activating enzyme
MHKIEAEIADIFSSFQGEGIFVGAKQIFVRFKSCNLDCVYCDEDKGAEPSIYTSASLMEAIEEIEEERGTHHSVSLTGGEPLVYSNFLKVFLPLLRKSRRRSYLETNGTLPDEFATVIDWIDIVAMDIKLPSSTGCGQFWKEHETFLKTALKKNVIVKVVVTPRTTVEDFRKAAKLMAAIAKDKPFIIQPATPVRGSDGEVPREALFELLEIGLDEGLDHIRVIPQVHKALGLK